MKLGLRFTTRDAGPLRDLADGLRNLSPEQRGGRDIDISLFDKAAESAERDEPLEVVCTDPEEVKQMAQAFPALGIAEPAIDELNG